ncbi:MAG: glycosyltransferase [Thermoanaerobaculum sp.]|nr:glycosyltransferase [Thermoanaerobaculum sp.]
MRLAYLLEDTALFGGVKIALQQAHLMAQRGHQVVVVSKGPRPRWFPLSLEFRQVPSFAPVFLPKADVTVATFWTTLLALREIPWGEKVHYCQGLEFTYTHNQEEHPAIERAYQDPFPAMVLAPHLGQVVQERFARPTRLVPPPLAPVFRPPWGKRRPHKRARILVVHPFENDWKGVVTALEAIKILRRAGVTCELVRLSQWPLSEVEQAVLPPDRYYCGLTEPQVARLLRRCDLLLAPSWEQEGFGLPVLEAMGSGVPVVASDISAFRFVTAGSALLVPPRQPEAFAEAAATLLADARRWRELAQAGVQRAQAFSPPCIAAAAEQALSWVATGAWRTEPRADFSWPPGERVQ